MPYTLTPHQQDIGEKIINAFKSGVKRIVLLGSAGVGKTVLGSWITEQFVKDRTINRTYNNGTVYVTAPTHKALGVLKSKIDLNVEFKTLHSALKLSRNIDRRTGLETFFQKKTYDKYRKGNEFDKCRFALADECSMIPTAIEGNNLPEDSEYHEKGYLAGYNFPILYMGDDKQLSPVGEKSSPVFTKGYLTFELTEIIRQGEGNPIIDLSRDLDLIYFKQPKINDLGHGYMYFDNKESIIKDLADVNGTDELKYLALTNVAVNGMNDAVRIKRYNTPRRVEKDETIVMNSPFSEFHTNKEVKVEDLEIIIDNKVIPTEKTRFEPDLSDYSGPVEYVKMKFYRINGSIDVLHEDSDSMFRVVADTIKENCSLHQWDYRGHKYFVEHFADIKYNHAITVHKSQGSTYKDAILNIQDIGICPNESDRRRLLYTGVTRASNLVILNNVK